MWKISRNYLYCKLYSIKKTFSCLVLLTPFFFKFSYDFFYYGLEKFYFVRCLHKKNEMFTNKSCRKQILIRQISRKIKVRGKYKKGTLFFSHIITRVSSEF